jgi:hypothetical protein
MGLLRDLAEAIGAIPDDPTHRRTDGPQYGYVDRAGGSAILLESKKDMKSRGLASPTWPTPRPDLRLPCRAPCDVAASPTPTTTRSRMADRDRVRSAFNHEEAA